MEFIPAIDILQGQCVRLLQGNRAAVTVYEKQPQKMAEFWQAQGAKRVHIVNLDGAFGMSGGNGAIVRDIVRNTSLSIQLGGGIRTLQDATNWLDGGVARIILGTVAFSNASLLDEILKKCSPERVIVGLDARDGLIAIKGWEQITSAQLLPSAQDLQARGVQRIIYTDIGRDGSLTGPDFSGTCSLCEHTQMQILASGGFASLEHFRQLSGYSHANLEGAIVGKALYEKKVSFKELVNLTQSLE